MWNSPLHTYRLPLEISSWLTFAISLTLYWITADPGVSYWDCPEYVTIASKMEVGHPPGNPVWMLAMRVATIPFPAQFHAYIINLCSGIFMAFAAFFLCRFIFIPTRISLNQGRISRKLSPKTSNLLSIIISLGASLCFAFCDSAWFSAVEAEVYAMSTFLSALSLWLLILWWWAPTQAYRTRFLVLLAYLLGISLGVHQLNLLLIPVYTIIIYYKYHPRKVNPLTIFIIFLISVILIGIILMALIPGVLFGAGKFEYWAVNGLNLPYNSGVTLFCLLLFSLILISLLLSFRFRIHPNEGRMTFQRRLSTLILCGIFLLIGFSSYAMIFIRSYSSPPMNEGTPDNIFSLSSYIARDQYPSTPLFYGHTPYSQPMLQEEFIDGKSYYSRYVLKKGKPRFLPYLQGAKLYHRSSLLSEKDSAFNKNTEKQGRGYVLTDYSFQQKLTPELDMWFPRLTSRNLGDRIAYEDWAGASEETMERIQISETYDSLGKAVAKLNSEGIREPVYSYRPTYWQNLKFFISYQAYYMYFRYLFWNFIGRQNDYPSTGEIDHGNFMTGIPYIDSNFLGITDSLPPELGRENAGHNRYFCIPFIIGLLGISYLAFSGRIKRRLLTVITVIFLMTGLAIVVYLNQTPGEPRERDYTFLVSFMAFTMWICAGFLFLINYLARYAGLKIIMAVSFVICLGTPALMAFENFDNNNRRNRFETTFYASSLLDFEEPALIFSHGDNTTFPLWYASEVLNMGKNHTPIDITYLNLPSYIANLKKQGKDFTTIAETPQILFGKYTLSHIPSDISSSPMPLWDALKALYTNEKAEWPTSLVTIKDSNGNDFTLNLHDFSKGSSFLSFQHLMLLDLLATQSTVQNPRILFFPSSIGYNFYKPLVPVLNNTLFGKIYAPFKSDSTVNWLTKQSVRRELSKLSHIYSSNFSLTRHYADPVTADITRRYRGELIIAAQDFFTRGDMKSATQLSDSILKFFPYKELSPGSFTIADSTFNEGKSFVSLLKSLYQSTGNPKYHLEATSLDSIMQNRYRQWLAYYNSLSPAQRAALSNRSLRMLKRP